MFKRHRVSVEKTGGPGDGLGNSYVSVCACTSCNGTLQMAKVELGQELSGGMPTWHAGGLGFHHQYWNMVATTPRGKKKGYDGKVYVMYSLLH